jgi:HSP20 family molecular chaperone IbpA
MPVSAPTQALDELLLRKRSNDERLTELLQASVAEGKHAPTRFHPPYDLFHRNGELILSIELPGVLSSDLEVSLDAQRLVVTGRFPEVLEIETTRLHSSRAQGTFRCEFVTPEAQQVGSHEFVLANGVLQIRLKLILLPTSDPADSPKLLED